MGCDEENSRRDIITRVLSGLDLSQLQIDFLIQTSLFLVRENGLSGLYNLKQAPLITCYPHVLLYNVILDSMVFLISFYLGIGVQSMTDLPPPPTQTYNIDSIWRVCGYTLQYNSGYIENEVMMR